MNKPSTSFDAGEQWYDYELLSTVANLLERDGRQVKIPSMKIGSVALMTIRDGRVSLKDLSALMLRIADYLENIENYS